VVSAGRGSDRREPHRWLPAPWCGSPRASIDAVRTASWCHPEWSAALTAPSMRFAIGVGVVLLRHTTLTASYAGSPHPTLPARPRFSRGVWWTRRTVRQREAA